MNVERADILGRVCAVRSIFLSSRDASPRRATLNAGQLVRVEVTRGDSRENRPIRAEICTPISPTGVAKNAALRLVGKKAIFEGILDRRFHISRGFPTTTPACILCGNYPIRPGRP